MAKDSKSFWRKPEGVTGTIFIAGAVGLATYAGFALGFSILGFIGSTLGIAVSLSVLGLIIFLALDGKSRALISYSFKSLMRWITGIFVQMDPIAILKGYVEDLRYNLKKMNQQIGRLTGQKHKLMEMIHQNKKDIKTNIALASKAKSSENQAQLILKSRKAGRLRDSNVKLEDLHRRMEVMHRVLSKMRDNSEVLVEDIDDQVKIKEQERKAIMAGHNAMKSAMTIIKGDKDKKALFDEALEAVADDVSQKVGEMERFMDVSEDFMKSIDLQNGIFEEKGLEMLEKWEKESTSLLLGEAKQDILDEVMHGETLDLKQKQKVKLKQNEYDDYFDE